MEKDTLLIIEHELLMKTNNTIQTQYAVKLIIVGLIPTTRVHLNHSSHA